MHTNTDRVADSTLPGRDSYLYGRSASYLIFKGDKQRASGDWELDNGEMPWKFEK